MKNFVAEYTYDDISIPFRIAYVDAGKVHKSLKYFDPETFE
jgi:hypothetical protein